MQKHNSLYPTVLFSLIILLSLNSTVHSVYSPGTKMKQPRMEFSPNRLIVKLKPEADKLMNLGGVRGKITTGLAELDKLNFKFKVEKEEKLFGEFKETALKSDELSSVYILEVQAQTDLVQMKKEFEARSEVEYVDLDYKVELFEVPNDTLFQEQWYLNNLGLAQNDSQGYLGTDRTAGHMQVRKFGAQDADVDALEVFEKNPETTLPLVGIIDTGVDTDHQDLSENVWTNPGEIPNNGIDDDHNGFIDDFYGWDFSGDKDTTVLQEDNDPTDYFGHGTHVAGIVAALRNNGIGISGLNTSCRILPIKIFPNSFTSVCVKGIIYAADMGCDVINMSWGSPYPSQLYKDALDYAVNKRVLPIAASGNSGAEECSYPACLPQVFAVGASNSKDEVTYFSTYGNHIQVVAPGEDILSLRADSTDMYAENGYPNSHIVAEKYYLADGTSMASPCAVGVAAYILSASPGISKERVKDIMRQSADDIIYPYGGNTLFSPGKDIYSGWGRVNLNSALKLLSGRLAKIDYPYENAIVTGTIPIVGTATGDSFQSYVLEYGEGLSPQVWTEIIDSANRVSKDTLSTWNTSALTGLYTLRLTVGDQNQAIVHVVVQNGTRVEITSPIQDDTIRGLAPVRGFTIVKDFSHYTLEYGYGESPVNWVTLITSTRMVGDSLLAEWLLSFLPEGIFTLRLSVEDTSGKLYSDEVRVNVKNIATGGWSKSLSGWGSLAPGVGDVNGDAYDEIVIGLGSWSEPDWKGGIQVFNRFGEKEPGWPKDTSEYMLSSPALGDLDGDGIDDLVICSDRGVHAYLSGSPGWFKPVYTQANALWSLANPVIADLDKDCSLEVLMMNNAGEVYAWHKDGKPVLGDTTGLFGTSVPCNPYEAYPSLTVADLDQDGQNEVIAGSADATGNDSSFNLWGGIFIWDAQGNRLLSNRDLPFQFGWIYGIAIANLDSSPDLEVITFGQNATHPFICAFKKDGSQPPGFPIFIDDIKAGFWFANHPAVGDLDGDGILEIVVTVWTLGEARIYAWHQDGTPLAPSGPLVSIKSEGGHSGEPIPFPAGRNITGTGVKNSYLIPGQLNNKLALSDTVFTSQAETFGSPILADVNRDGNVDIICRTGYYFGSGYERVFAWDYSGNLIPGWPLYASEQAASGTYRPYSPVITDIDKDGKLNLILTTDSPEFKLIRWKFDTGYNPKKMHWPRYMHDKQNRGIFELKDYTGVQGEQTAPVPAAFRLFQNHPNPFNSQTVIEYSLPGPSQVKLTVYNLLGQKVRTLLDRKEAPGTKKVLWDGRNENGDLVSSGIYFYRLKTEKYAQVKKMVFLK